jgi:hypothetical protein
MDLQQLLARVDDTHGLSDEEWRFVLDELLRTLGDFLGAEAELREHLVVDRVAVHSRIRSTGTFAGALNLGWEGVLGVEPIQGAAYVAAFIFLFGDGERLMPKRQYASYVELRYALDSGWQSLGWRHDEYGEFDHIQAYTGKTAP